MVRYGRKEEKTHTNSYRNRSEYKDESLGSSHCKAIIILRMTSYPDLFAFDAKYHRSCLAHHLSEHNICAAQRKVAEYKKDSSCDQAFIEIVDEIQNTLLSKKKSVTTLSQIKVNFGN